MYIERNLEKKIKKYLKSPEIIAIVGPRQAGKTTLLLHLIKNLKQASYISFENQEVLNLFETAPDDFIAAYIKGNKYLFIDEFHYAKNGGKILKYIFDTEKTKIIISGSSAIDLTVKTIKHLVGRILVFSLYPFDFKEFLLAKDPPFLKLYLSHKKKLNLKKPTAFKVSPAVEKKLLRYYDEYLLFGGYPRVVLAKSYTEKKDLLTNIYNTYFLREVRDILGLIDDYKLNNLLKALALQIGSLLEYNELSRVSEFSYLSVKKYLNFLEKTYICNFIKPFFQNKRIEIVKNPKVYFFDTGLRNAAIDDFRPLTQRPDKGGLLENGLAMEAIKKEIKLNFWRSKKGQEVDFIFSLGDGEIIAVEVKNYLKTLHSSSAKAFKNNYPEIKFYFAYREVEPNLKDKYIFPIYFF